MGCNFIVGVLSELVFLISGYMGKLSGLGLARHLVRSLSYFNTNGNGTGLVELGNLFSCSIWFCVFSLLLSLYHGGRASSLVAGAFTCKWVLHPGTGWCVGGYAKIPWVVCVQIPRVRQSSNRDWLWFGKAFWAPEPARCMRGMVLACCRALPCRCRPTN